MTKDINKDEVKELKNNTNAIKSNGEKLDELVDSARNVLGDGSIKKRKD